MEVFSLNEVHILICMEKWGTGETFLGKLFGSQ